MNKTLKQTKENKKKFWSPLIDLLKIGTPVTRSELQDAVGFSDRAVRNEVSNISKFHPVISYSSRKGYRIAKDFSKLNVEEAAAEWLEVEHSLNELKARNRDINKRMKPLIAYQKKMEKVRPEIVAEIKRQREEARNQKYDAELGD
jgi:predicted transcriptional regulator